MGLPRLQVLTTALQAVFVLDNRTAAEKAAAIAVAIDTYALTAESPVIAPNFISTAVAGSGTQPYACSSEEKCVHLNADMVDGKHDTDFVAAADTRITGWEDAAARAHDQNSDTFLDEGGDNEVSAADAASAVSQMHTHTGARWELIQTTTPLAQAAASMQITGLDGDVDLEYLILLHVPGNAYNQTVFLGMGFNGAGGTAYYAQVTSASGATLTGASYSAKAFIRLATITTVAQIDQFIIHIPFAASGVRRQVFSQGSLVGATAAPSFADARGMWTGTANITTIEFGTFWNSDDSSQIGLPIGTYAKVFARRA